MRLAENSYTIKLISAFRSSGQAEFSLIFVNLLEFQIFPELRNGCSTVGEISQFGH